MGLAGFCRPKLQYSTNHMRTKHTHADQQTMGAGLTSFLVRVLGRKGQPIRGDAWLLCQWTTLQLLLLLDGCRSGLLLRPLRRLRDQVPGRGGRQAVRSPPGHGALHRHGQAWGGD